MLTQLILNRQSVQWPLAYRSLSPGIYFIYSWKERLQIGSGLGFYGVGIAMNPVSQTLDRLLLRTLYGYVDMLVCCPSWGTWPGL